MLPTTQIPATAIHTYMYIVLCRFTVKWLHTHKKVSPASSINNNIKTAR